MDWNAAIYRNREALKRILAMLVAMAGGEAAFTSPLWGGRREASGGGCAPTTTPTRQSDDCRPPHKGEVKPEFPLTLPRHLHRAILALLRPAEAAARRLVIVAACELAATPQARNQETVTLPGPRKVKPKAGSIFVRSGKGTGIVLPAGVQPGAILPGLTPPRQAPRTLALPLLDPLPGWPGHLRPPANGVSRISAPGIAELHRGPDRRPPLPGDAIDATRLSLRLRALGRVLDDLPAHARRFARWRLRRDAAGAQNRENRAGPLTRVWPLRPGRPPGGRRRPTHEVHAVLADLHSFAFWALEQFQPNRAAVLRPELRKTEETERPDSS